MNDRERHSKRKAFWTTRFFEEESVEDKDGGYTSYKQVKVKELFGVLMGKHIASKKTNMNDSEKGSVIGFKDGSRQNTE